MNSKNISNRRNLVGTPAQLFLVVLAIVVCKIIPLKAADYSCSNFNRHITEGSAGHVAMVVSVSPVSAPLL